jgi:hypothetical protein
MRQFLSFASWEHLQQYIAGGYPVYYQAPLDALPVRVSTAIRRDGRIRVYPIFASADAFTANIDHLPRFRRVANVGVQS